MEAEFQGKEIEFISISIDKNRKKWKEYVREHQLGGVQLWAGDWSYLPEELHVGSIPRFILIDKEGNWVDTEALRPSNPALKKLLKNLLKNDRFEKSNIDLLRLSDRSRRYGKRMGQ